MARPGPFPFAPDMKDCRKVIRTKSGICYMMDSCCRDMTAADKAAADERILQVYADHARKREKAGSG